MAAPSTVGDHITTHCTQCQLRRDHTVVAMDGLQITTVACTVCGGVAAFSPASPPPKVRVARAKKGASAPPSGEPLWQAKMSVATGKERPYTRTAAYHLNDILIHEQFGKGVVVKLGEQKCHVLFQDKERLMASAN